MQTTTAIPEEIPGTSPAVYRRACRTGVVVYLLMGISFLLPAEWLQWSGHSVYSRLADHYPGMMAEGITLLAGVLQSRAWFRKKIWLVWPGILAGIYNGIYGLRKLAGLSIQDGIQENAPLAIPQAMVTPGTGLYLLIFSAWLMVALNFWYRSNRGRLD